MCFELCCSEERKVKVAGDHFLPSVSSRFCKKTNVFHAPPQLPASLSISACEAIKVALETVKEHPKVAYYLITLLLGLTAV